MRYVTGVEVSVTWASQTVHIVGLQIDPACRALIDGLHDTRSGRARRARDMSEALAGIGIAGAYEGALRYVGNPDLISRTHFARWLVDQATAPTSARCSTSTRRKGGRATSATVGPRWPRPCTGSARPAALP